MEIGGVYFFLTRHRITHSASCKLRSASSRMRLLAPRQTIDTVCTGPLTPVTLTVREPEAWTSSMRSAEPSLSSEKESISAMGLQPVLYSELGDTPTLVLEGTANLANKFHFISLNVLHREDVELGQEM